MTTKTRRRPLVAGPAKGYPPQAVMRAEVLRLINHRLSQWPLDDLVVIGMITGHPDRTVLLRAIEMAVDIDAAPPRDSGDAAYQ